MRFSLAIIFALWKAAMSLTCAASRLSKVLARMAFVSCLGRGLVSSALAPDGFPFFSRIEELCPRVYVASVRYHAV